MTRLNLKTTEIKILEIIFQEQLCYLLGLMVRLFFKYIFLSISLTPVKFLVFCSILTDILYVFRNRYVLHIGEKVTPKAASGCRSSAISDIVSVPALWSTCFRSGILGLYSTMYDCHLLTHLKASCVLMSGIKGCDIYRLVRLQP